MGNTVTIPLAELDRLRKIENDLKMRIECNHQDISFPVIRGGDFSSFMNRSIMVYNPSPQTQAIIIDIENKYCAEILKLNSYIDALQSQSLYDRIFNRLEF